MFNETIPLTSRYLKKKKGIQNLRNKWGYRCLKWSDWGSLWNNMNANKCCFFMSQ